MEIEVPNKVYVKAVQVANRKFLHVEPTPENGPREEFIRKDYILNRLKVVAAAYKKRSDEGELVWQNMCGIKEAIDIINKI